MRLYADLCFLMGIKLGMQEFSKYAHESVRKSRGISKDVHKRVRKSRGISKETLISVVFVWLVWPNPTDVTVTVYTLFS